MARETDKISVLQLWVSRLRAVPRRDSGDATEFVVIFRFIDTNSIRTMTGGAMEQAYGPEMARAVLKRSKKSPATLTVATSGPRRRGWLVRFEAPVKIGSHETSQGRA